MMCRIDQTLPRKTSATATSRRLMYVLTVPLSLRFIAGQPLFLRRHGFHPTAIITAPGKDLDTFALSQGVDTFPIAMERRITPMRDLLAVWRLWRAIRHFRPTIVSAHTPKGGLLGTLAAWLARV